MRRRVHVPSGLFASLATALALLAVGMGLAIAGCGGEVSVDKGEVTLKVRPEGSLERRLLGQIYAQALDGAGYRVKMMQPEFESAAPVEEVKKGRLAGYPEYLSTALFYEFGVEIEDIPKQALTAYGELKRDLGKQDLVAFPPAPYGIEYLKSLR
jgi:osmoprotectant transport system substrate-binding protein